MSEKIDKSGQAFPLGVEPAQICCGGQEERDRVMKINADRQGMTKREYFSTHILGGLLVYAPAGASAAALCDEAVKMADLLIHRLKS